MNELHQFASSRDASELLAVLTPLVNAKLAEMAHLIELRRYPHLQEVTLAMTRGLGKQQMALIRAQMSECVQAEEVVLQTWISHEKTEFMPIDKLANHNVMHSIDLGKINRLSIESSFSSAPDFDIE